MAKSTYTELITCPPRSDMNTGLSAASHGTMMALFGAPGNLTANCSEATNPKIKQRLETRNVGPFRVTGLKPAVQSLELIFSEIKQERSELYGLLGTEGMFCCRHVRGKSNFFSNHSWGTAIDLTIGGLLPDMDATKIPHGFITIYPYFHKHGWFWGAGYSGRTDPMHFEIANETIKKWKTDGLIG